MVEKASAGDTRPAHQLSPPPARAARGPVLGSPLKRPHSQDFLELVGALPLGRGRARKPVLASSRAL
eukprot:3066021-Pyramimonas_sp.AAC.1